MYAFQNAEVEDMYCIRLTAEMFKFKAGTTDSHKAYRHPPPTEKGPLEERPQRANRIRD